LMTIDTTKGWCHFKLAAEISRNLRKEGPAVLPLASCNICLYWFQMQYDFASFTAHKSAIQSWDFFSPLRWCEFLCERFSLWSHWNPFCKLVVVFTKNQDVIWTLVEARVARFFLIQQTKTGNIIPKWPQKYQTGHKKYQNDKKYAKTATKYLYQILHPSKLYQIWHQNI
jgi:hypothetical protein